MRERIGKTCLRIVLGLLGGALGALLHPESAWLIFAIFSAAICALTYAVWPPEK